MAIALLAILLQLSCKKNLITDPEPSSAITTNAQDVYIVGANGTDVSALAPKAYLYSNQKLMETPLNGEIKGIRVFSNKVYYFGASFPSNTTIASATFWKDNIPTVPAINFPDGTTSSKIYDLVSKGDDLYIAGTYYYNQRSIPFYAINGNFYKLDIPTSGWLTGTSKIKIAVTETNNVYVTVSFVNNAGQYIGNWMDGQYSELVNVPYIKHQGFLELFDCVSNGKDVYTVGSMTDQNKNTAFYCKNKELIKLSDDTKSTRAFTITIKDNDIYVGGQIAGVACVWKNNKENITLLECGTYEDSQVRAIGFNGNQPVFAGIMSKFINTTSTHVEGESKLVYWKNNQYTIYAENNTNWTANNQWITVK